MVVICFCPVDPGIDHLYSDSSIHIVPNSDTDVPIFYSCSIKTSPLLSAACQENL
jgi:hypothetical protein